MKHVKEQDWRGGLSEGGAVSEHEFYSVFDTGRGKDALRRQRIEVKRETSGALMGPVEAIPPKPASSLQRKLHERPALARAGVAKTVKRGAMQHLPDFLKRDLRHSAI